MLLLLGGRSPFWVPDLIAYRPS
ncbi:unnamed protein product [Linum tenue]|uniref:Uncharacterized protein n=1 Tax=Linum tenue TaxID=586396 RepID=A0AAV0LR85_9ROSI|nr:unnamed protein product [Linum tenue]